MADLLELVKALGPLGAIAAVLIYRDWLRERDASATAKATELFIRETLLGQINETRQVCTAATSTIEQLVPILREVVDLLRAYKHKES